MINERFIEPDGFVYPQKLVENLNISIKEAYQMLEDDDTLVSVLKLECPSCGELTDDYYLSFFDVPHEVYCPHCKKLINNRSEHSIVVYKRKKI